MIKTLTSVLLAGLLLGCAETMNLVDTKEAVDDGSFHTDLTHYKGAFKTPRTKEQRDALISELITASNMQCNAYQYQPSKEKEEQTSSGYVTMFKIVGKYIGLDIANDAIDAVSAISDMGQKKSNRDKYAAALKPNIIKGVEVARKKYLAKIKTRQAKGLQSYSILDFQEDLKAYDKRCSTYYGLMEINKALEASLSMPSTKKSNIKVDEIKEKIKAVTKEVRVWKINKEVLDSNCSADGNFTKL